MIRPPVWDSDQLRDAAKRAEDHFRERRHAEPLEEYLELFDEYQGIVEEFLEETVDLTDLSDCALDLWRNGRKQEVFRYLTGPPVSLDDLKVLLDAPSLSIKAMQDDPALVASLISFMRSWHDRRRFPWLTENYEPQEHDRKAAVIATASLLAMRRLETSRRTSDSSAQERRIETQLVRAGLRKVDTRRIRTLGDAPGRGQFCRECYLGSCKADFVIGLWDGRTMALECKVSNSATNSVKRLNREAAVKAETWRTEFGSNQVVPAGVLSGVYKLHNLENAQQRGLALFWAHDSVSITNWIQSTRSSESGLSPG